MSDTKEIYRQFCRTAPADFPVFMQHWYLDAVCTDGEWSAAVVEEAGKIVAVWPYFGKKKLIWEYVAMPAIGKLMGPYLIPDCRSPKMEVRIMRSLIAGLPAKLAAFEQDCNYTFQNWLPLYWEGYQQTTRYSYTIDLTQSSETIWKNISKDYRSKIKKAEEMLTVRHDLGIDELFQTGFKSFERQGINTPFTADYFRRMIEATEANHAGKSFFAVEEKTGEIHASGYLIWDQNAAYTLWGGNDAKYNYSNGTVFLIWKRLQFAREELKLPEFDFLGSMMKNIEPGRRYFGASQKPYFRIAREWSPLWKWGKILLR